MKQYKSNLDEMQEQKLLKIEHNGCWLAFWGLFASLIVQTLLFPEELLRVLAGEWVVFMVLCAYLLVACIKNGIWDRRLHATAKVNLLVSGAGALVVGVVFFFFSLRNYGDPFTAALTGVMMLVGVFVCCFAALSIGMAIYKKRVQALEERAETASGQDA